MVPALGCNVGWAGGCLFAVGQAVVFRDAACVAFAQKLMMPFLFSDFFFDLAQIRASDWAQIMIFVHFNPLPIIFVL
jgi:hypothetical protein